MSIKRLVPILAIIALAGAFLAYRVASGRSQSDPSRLSLSGNIEITDADVGFKIAGRVETRRVDEGQAVSRGDIVAELDRADLLSELAMRQAELQAADAALAELEAGSRPQEIAEAAAALARTQAFLDELVTGSRPQEIAVAEATVARARADLADAETNYSRVRDLRDRQMAAQQEYDSAKARFDAAAAQLREAEEKLKLVKEGPRQEEIDQARAALDQAKERLSLVREGPRKETIAQARARAAQAKANLGLTETRLGYATLTSPLTGIVLSKNIEPGEYVAPGTPIVTVGDLEHVWLRAYVNETDLGRVKVGQPATVTTDTYPGRSYPGRVSFISSQAEFTPKSVQTTKERVKLVYRIKIDIENPQMELKPGMPADAEIQLDSPPAGS